jgi:hypothetical protein
MESIHHIEPGGRQEQACAEPVKQGFDPLWVERWSEGGEKTRKSTQSGAGRARHQTPKDIAGDR